MRLSGVRVALVAALVAGIAGTVTATASADTSSRAPTKFTGSPYTIAMLTGDSPAAKFPETEALMDLGIKKINKKGGIAGHQLRKTACAAGADANSAAECARKAVADPSVVAMWSYTSYFPAVDPIIESAKIPTISFAPNSPLELSCAMCFPTQGGYVATGGSTALLAAQVLKAKSANYVVLDVPAGVGFPVFAQSFLDANGLTMKNNGVTPIPLTATDLTAQAVKAGQGADAIIFTSFPSHLSAFLQTAKQQDVKTPIVSLMSALPLATVKQLGAAAEGVYLTTAYDYDSHGAKKARKALNKAGLPESNEAMAAYTAPFLLAAATKGQTSVTGASVVAGLQKLTNFDGNQGLYPTIDYTKPFTGYGGQLPKLYDRTIYYYRVVHGKYKLIKPKQRLLLPGT